MKLSVEVQGAGQEWSGEKTFSRFFLGLNYSGLIAFRCPIISAEIREISHVGGKCGWAQDERRGKGCVGSRN